MSLTRVSMTESVSGRYIVACDTPDGGRSTYRECWGAGSKYSERAVYASDRLADAVAHAESLGYVRRVVGDEVVTTGAMHATVYDRRTGRAVGKARIAEALAAAAR